MKKLFSLLIILSFIGLGSCNKKDSDPDYCAGAWATQVEAELNAVIAAAMTYGTDPTLANCNAYKAAIQDYIDALRPFENCNLWSAEVKAAFNDALDEAEADLEYACD